ncbi:hypothetical protein QUA54_33005 [Microcoleus sp. MOSTC5]|uniref:hypothetical protein n=1 Tax=Microcoleus sp. MOSTC5 TaxID=3055378 RepID=UPI002FD1B7A1
MAIPSVWQGRVQPEEGDSRDSRFYYAHLESPEGLEWLASISSFRFEPDGESLKPFTVRKETTRTGDYWYGYKKIAGRLHKKYVGKSSEMTIEKLEEIAEALNIPPQPRVTDKVAEVTEKSDRVVTDKVTDRVTIEEFTALKSQVQALQETLEALLSELPGKLRA